MAKNDLTKKENNAVAVTGGLAIQQQLIGELEKASQEFGVGFTEYGLRCAINSIAGVLMFTKQNGIDIKEIDPTLLRLQIQNVGYTELNCATMPSEVYFDIRKSTNADGKLVYQLTIKPQGAGNEKLVRKYGVGLKEGTGLHPAVLIREGDEFVLPSYNGITITPFKYVPKLENANNKVIAVVYPIEKADGTIDYLYATRDSVKPNIIAQIRQNTLYEFKKVVSKYTDKYGNEREKTEIDVDARNEFYERINQLAEKLSVDELLENEEVKKYVNPTYTSGGSKEAMILRKMKNNALKYYPKEYDNTMVAESVHNMWEENDTSVIEKKNAKQFVKDVDAQVDEDVNEDTIPDFDLTDEQKAQGKSFNADDFKPVNEVVDNPADKKVDEKVDEDDDIPF